MLHVINNPLAASDGFTGYRVGFGIRWERKQQGRGYGRPRPEHCAGSVGRTQGGGVPSWLSYCFLFVLRSIKSFIRVGVTK